MKKLIIVLALIALVTTGAFAQVKLSAGGGMLLDISDGNGVKSGGMEIKSENISFGFFGFFDATYVEANVYFSFGNVDNFGIAKSEYTQLGVQVLGKYPFDVGFCTLFPLVGISFNYVISATNYVSTVNVADLSQFGILLGVGADFNLTEKIFIRGSALLQLRLPSKLMEDTYRGSGVELTPGFGPIFKVAVGFRF